VNGNDNKKKYTKQRIIPLGTECGGLRKNKCREVCFIQVKAINVNIYDDSIGGDGEHTTYSTNK
jgi:hypothetical protein